MSGGKYPPKFLRPPPPPLPPLIAVFPLTNEEAGLNDTANETPFSALPPPTPLLLSLDLGEAIEAVVLIEDELEGEEREEKAG